MKNKKDIGLPQRGFLTFNLINFTKTKTKTKTNINYFKDNV